MANNIWGALSQTAYGVGNVVTQYAQQQYKLQTAQEYNSARMGMLRSSNDFLSSLEKDPDYKNFNVKFEEFKKTAYPQITGGMTSTDAKNQFEMDWGLQMENLRGDVQKMSLQRGRTMSRGQLVVDLQDAVDMGPTGIVKEENMRDYFVTAQKGRIRALLDTAAAGGYLSPEEHEAMLNKYVPMFEKTYITNEALGMLRKGQDVKDVEQWVLDQDLVTLGVGDRESLIWDIRREASAISSRQVTQEAAAIETNDVELYKLWATPEGRAAMMKDDFKLVTDMYGDTPAGRKAAESWMQSLGSWSIKAEEDRKQEEAKRKWDIEIQRILTDKDASAIDKTISEIMNDTTILDAERDSMVSNLNAMKLTFSGEGIVAGKDGEEYNAEPVRAEYDAKILDVTYDVMDGKANAVTKVKNLIQEIENHPYFKGNEQDRNERTTKLLGLLKDLDTKAPAAVSAKSNITDMFANPAYQEKDIRDAIRKAEVVDNTISGDEARALYSWLPDRAETFLGDQNAGIAITTMNRYFASRVNRLDLPQDEAALLAQEQMTANTGLKELLDSKEYLGMSKTQKKEQIDLIMHDMLDPSITRSFAQMALGVVGLGGSERPDKYSLFQSVESPSYAGTLQKELETEWITKLKTDYSNIDTANIQAKRTMVDGKYIIELRHAPSGVLLTLRNGKWYAKWPGDKDYVEVKNRVFGADTAKKLEALR